MKREKFIVKGKHSWHFYTACATIVAIIIIFSAYLEKIEEYSYEMADLQAMRNADVTAMMKWKNKLPDEMTEYWYDPHSFELIQTNNPKPESHGLGRKRKGGAVEEFESDTNVSYEYDEGTDYNNKVIRVIVRNEEGKLDIRVNWVDAE